MNISSILELIYYGVNKTINMSIHIDITCLVRKIDKHPEFKTTFYNGGNYFLCHHHLNKSQDDWGYKKHKHQYCTNTSQPYIQFKITNLSQKWVNFLNYLNTKLQTYPTTLTLHQGEYTYGYSNADEGFKLDTSYLHEVVATKPKFKEFWINFLEAWKIFIDSSLDIEKKIKVKELDIDLDKYIFTYFTTASFPCYNTQSNTYKPNEFDIAGDLIGWNC